MMTLIIASALVTMEPTDPGTGSPAGGNDRTHSYKVLFVPDGDSVVLSVDGKTVRVFLLGVEGPGPESERVSRVPRTRLLRELLDGRSVFLTYRPGLSTAVRGSRTADLYRSDDGVWINLEVIMRGYGRVPTAGAFNGRERFVKAEAEARKARRGMWAPDFLVTATSEAERLSEAAWEERQKVIHRRMDRLRRKREEEAARRAEYARIQDLEERRKRDKDEGP